MECGAGTWVSNGVLRRPAPPNARPLLIRPPPTKKKPETPAPAATTSPLSPFFKEIATELLAMAQRADPSAYGSGGAPQIHAYEAINELVGGWLAGWLAGARAGGSGEERLFAEERCARGASHWRRRAVVRRRACHARHGPTACCEAIESFG
jgi:hypothetical protein